MYNLWFKNLKGCSLVFSVFVSMYEVLEFVLNIEKRECELLFRCGAIWFWFFSYLRYRGREIIDWYKFGELNKILIWNLKK